MYFHSSTKKDQVWASFRQSAKPWGILHETHLWFMQIPPTRHCYSPACLDGERKPLLAVPIGMAIKSLLKLRGEL